MKFKKPVSVALDPEVADEARKYAAKEHTQLSSYIQTAVMQRNKWHEREEEKERTKKEELTIEEAKKELLKELETKQFSDNMEKTFALAKELWAK